MGGVVSLAREWGLMERGAHGIVHACGAEKVNTGIIGPLNPVDVGAV